MARPSAGCDRLVLVGLLVLAAAGWQARALENGLARTPPMGWVAWARFMCNVDCRQYPRECVNAQLFRDMAARLAEDNWLQLGYQYLNIDDCWDEHERDPATERLVADRARFPDGIAKLAEFVHHFDGLKLGIYGDCGASTCGGYPGQLRANLSGQPAAADDFRTSTYFALDAQTFADWQVDSFKFDGCHVDPLRAERICPKMAQALREAGRPILLVCEWPFYMMYAHAEPDWELAGSSCNVWRYYDDIEGPGRWFDPDQLVIGNFGLSVQQARAQMALWCVWAAPLYMSNDLRTIKPEFAAILRNRHLIGVDQDQLGVMGLMVRQSADGLQQAFVKPMLPIKSGCPSFAIVYLNRATLGNAQKVSFELGDLLLRAPVRQAQRNQERVLQFERTAGEAGGRGASDELEELLREADGEEGAMRYEQREPRAESVELIRTHECLQRLRKAAEFRPERPGGGPSPPLGLWSVGQRSAAPTGERLEFLASDLFEDGRALGSLALHQPLELLVEPSSVRAVKLVEK